MHAKMRSETITKITATTDFPGGHAATVSKYFYFLKFYFYFLKF